MDQQTQAAGAVANAGSAYSWYALSVLVLICMCNFIDRQLIAILAEEIKRDLHLADQQLGILYGTVFAIFFALFGIPLGRLADGWYRTRLIALGLVLWSAMTILSGCTSSFTVLAAARMCIGVGEATGAPASYSLLGDYFDRARKGLVLAIYSSGTQIGIGLSLLLGGYIVHQWHVTYGAGPTPLGLAGWQAAFLVAGAPGLLLALWCLSLREPPRGAGEGIPSAIVQPGIWKAFGLELAAIVPPFTLITAFGFRHGLLVNLTMLVALGTLAAALTILIGDALQWTTLGVGIYCVASWVQTLRYRDPATFALTWGQPIVVLAIIGFGLIPFIGNTAGFWMSPYAMRTFHLSALDTGVMIGLPSVVASVAGLIAGGRLSDMWKTREPRARIFMCMISLVSTTAFALIAMLAETIDIYVTVIPFFFFSANLWTGPAIATLQEIVLPRMRGIAAATSSIGVTMTAYALGPYVSGKVAAVTGSLQTGILSLCFAMPLSLALLWRVSRGIVELESSRIRRAMEAGEPLHPSWR